MKKLNIVLLVLPVTLISVNFIRNYYGGQFGAQDWLLLEIALNFLPLFLFIGYDLRKHARFTWVDSVVRSSFYVYLGILLPQLAIGLFPFADLILEGKYSTSLLHYLRYNLYPLESYLVHSYTTLALWGNLFLLFPFGVYLVLLYEIRSFKKGFLLILGLALMIELSQLLGSFVSLLFSLLSYSRGFDIDDILFNTAGGILGFWVAKFLYLSIKKFINFKIRE